MTVAADRSYGVIFLGASQFPYKPGLDNPAFAASKREVASVLTSEFLIADSVVYLDLFDDPASQADIAMQVDEFLHQQRHLTDIIFYYCGHGGFLTNRTYYLTLRSTRYGQEAVTGLVLNNFKMSLEDSLSNKRVYLLLDCCFAAAAFTDWMTDDGVSEVIRHKVEMAFPPSGAALLCAAGKHDPAIAPKGDKVTLFSGHLVRAVREGIENSLPELSLDDIAVHLRNRIRNEPTEHRKVIPELHVTGLQKGDVSRLPLVRNRGLAKPESPPSVTNFWSSPYTTIIQMAGYSSAAPQSQPSNDHAKTAAGETVSESKGSAEAEPQPQPSNDRAKSASDEPVIENTAGGRSRSARGKGDKKSPGTKGPTSKPVRDRAVNAPPPRSTKPKTIESAVPVSHAARMKEFLRENRGPVASLAVAGILFSIYLTLPQPQPQPPKPFSTASAPPVVVRPPVSAPPVISRPPLPAPPIDLVPRANAFLEGYMRRASGPIDGFVTYAAANYEWTVRYYDRAVARDVVISDKKTSLGQWTKRSYVVDPDTLSVRCDPTEQACRLSGNLRFQLESPAKNLLRTGEESFEYRVVLKDDFTRITEEKGNVISRIDKELTPAPAPPTPSRPAVDLVTRANAFLDEYMRRASGPADDYISYVSATYQSPIPYFGKMSTRDEVVQSKRAHAVRWPQRSYRPTLETVKINCEPPTQYTCRISGMLKYRTESAARNEFAMGDASFEFRVVLRDNSAVIVEENGYVVSRQTGELKPAPPPKSEIASCINTAPPQIAAVGGPLVPVSISIEPDLAKAAKMRSVRVSPDGSLFVTTGDDGFIRLWNATTLKLERILFHSPKSVGGIAFSNNGALLAVTGTDGTIRIWTMSNIAADPVALRNLAEPTGPIHSLAFAPNSSPTYLVAGFKSGRIEIWDAQKRKLLHSKYDPSTKIDPGSKLPPAPIRSVSFPPDPSGSFVSAGQGTIWFHELGRETAPVQAHASGVSSVQYSPDGRSVLSAGHDGKLKLWDAAKRAPIRTSDAPDLQYVFAATWSRDGTRIASGGADRKVSQWDAASLRRIRSFEGHKGDVEAVAFDASGKRIFSVSEDKTLKVWDAASGKELATIVPSGNDYLAYTPNSCYFGSESVERLFKVIENGVRKNVYPELKRVLFTPQGFAGLMPVR